MNMLFLTLAVIFILIAILIVAIIEECKRKRDGQVSGELNEFWDNGDRRRHLRVSIPLKVRYKPQDAGKDIVHKSSMSKDISETGVGIRLFEKFKEGSIVNLEIDLPDSSIPVSARGSIVWLNELPADDDGRRNFSAGVEFISVEEKDKERLTRYIKDAAGKLRGI